MTDMFHIIAYPNGVSTVVGTHHARHAEEVVNHAVNSAKVRGEYVDVASVQRGRIIATVGAEGVIGNGFGEGQYV